MTHVGFTSCCFGSAQGEFLSPTAVLVLVGLCLAGVIVLYFQNNPLKHDQWFLMRRFINWFPLGMTYAFLYMGRFNLNVAKNALGELMSVKDLGTIFAVGTIVYGLSFLINGPLVDKIGGKRGIIIAALGASLANIALGILTFQVVTHQMKIRLVFAFSVIYAVNMYFQSYGAVSIIKVKAYWFHVRERGVFSAIFGTLISFGVYFAFDWGQAIVNMGAANPKGQLSWLHRLIQHIFALPGSSVDATWAVFFAPAAILIVWAALDFWLIKDTPEEADFAHFDTYDASSGQMHIELTTMDLLKRVFASRLMLLIAAIGLSIGVLRNGILQWGFVFVKEVHQPAATFFLKNWGLLMCIFGIIGGFTGIISDKFFQSRRGPPVAMCCGIMFILTSLMAVFLNSSPLAVGIACVLTTAAAIGVHALMSGTAAADFGGRKATATCSGIVDGFVYLGGGIQSFCIGHLVGDAANRNWLWWPMFMMPFAVLGGVLALKIWHELPAATRKYIAEVEEKAEIELVPE
ncbi:MAG: MFS transporter [Verrucomicrobia bacterium]|nr:MAG: MFS transporter [Verrucomicrobiota bacterium]